MSKTASTPAATPAALSQPFVGVHLRYNRTATGRRTVIAARGIARYVAYGRPSLQETAARGQWEGPDGRPHEHESVLAWIQNQASHRRYTVHAVLSTPQADLPAAAYREALDQGAQSDDYRLMVHGDSDYSHAHVLFFWDKRLDKERFLEWQTNVRAVLAQREWEQLNGHSLATQTDLNQSAVEIADDAALSNQAAANLDLAYSGGGYDYP
jgi:hypothetical protein